VNFKNYSQGNIATFFWNFGDGSTSTESDPEKIYEETGVFPVVLMVSSNEGVLKSKSEVDYIQVYPRVCLFRDILDEQRNVGYIRKLRDYVILHTDWENNFIPLYYRRSFEIAAIIKNNNALKERLSQLIADNMKPALQLLSNGTASIPEAAVNDTVEFLHALKEEAGTELDEDLDIVIENIENGYLLDGLGFNVVDPNQAKIP
jgi:PKD repeat protein